LYAKDAITFLHTFAFSASELGAFLSSHTKFGARHHTHSTFVSSAARHFTATVPSCAVVRFLGGLTFHKRHSHKLEMPAAGGVGCGRLCRFEVVRLWRFCYFRLRSSRGRRTSVYTSCYRVQDPCYGSSGLPAGVIATKLPDFRKFLVPAVAAARRRVRSGHPALRGCPWGGATRALPTWYPDQKFSGSWVL
jgi:hypothetical protein